MILKELKIETWVGDPTNCYIIFDENSKEVMCIDPAGDVDKMEVALKTIEDQRIRQEMSNSALQKVKNEYVTDRVFEKIILLYQGIINHENK